jgi:hypothetical protein
MPGSQFARAAMIAIAVVVVLGLVLAMVAGPTAN